MTNVMLDLETLGTGTNSVIIAIGAVEFDPDFGGIGREFYQIVNAQSCVDVGMEIDAETVMWWMQQSVEAKAAFKQPGSSLALALVDFTYWIQPGSKVWGNGAAFDNVLLANAYKKLNMVQPWKYSDDRCYRTLKALYPEVEVTYSGTAHNALDDAKNQARHAIEIFRKMSW